MQVWQQVYDPIGNIWLSSLIASLPILFFFFALIKLKLKGYIAATITVGIALLVALFFYQMPADRAFASVIYGFFMVCGLSLGSSSPPYLYTNIGKNRAV